MVNRAAIAGNVMGFFFISHLQTSLDYNLRIRWFLCPETLSPLTYRAKVSGESHSESLTITSQLQFAYIKSILI